jgi:beta-phosphoglucomutase-like phosphatase (HAD superfamily)
VSPVVGRAYAEPNRMKPNPEPIWQAVRAIGKPAMRCVLVGDSLSDIDGAHAAGVRVIGYANRHAKVEVFGTAGADVVLTSMADVADALIGRSG